MSMVGGSEVEIQGGNVHRLLTDGQKKIKVYKIQEVKSFYPAECRLSNVRNGKRTIVRHGVQLD